MMPITYLVMSLWVPGILAFFKRYEPYVVAIWGMVIGWCFLPNYEIVIQGVPNINKINLTGIAVILACYLYDRPTFKAFKMTRYDLPMLVFMLSAVATSVSNGLGVYDGFSEMFRSIFLYGIPYFVGRLYFKNIKSLRLLLYMIFLAGVIYIPFCLFEVRMSPQLHRMVYGFSIISFVEAIRYGGFRPTVFMTHGLMVAFWMCTALVCGFGLFRAGLLPKKLLGDRLPTAPTMLVLLATTFLCRSTGAVVLMLLSVLLIWWIAKSKMRVLLVIFLLAFPVYIYIRCAELFNYTNLIMRLGRINEERAQSLEFRFTNEDALTRRALERPYLGWGGWGRARIYDESGRDLSVTDSMWIIYLGNRGIIGLGSLTVAMTLAAILICFRLKKAKLAPEDEIIFITTATVIAMYMGDNMVNNMPNALVIALAGALTGCCVEWETVVETSHAHEPGSTTIKVLPDSEDEEPDAVLTF